MARIILVILLLMQSAAGIFAQLDTGSFVHLSLKNGFPSNNVYSVLQDRNGYLWFATDYGLVKYNGYTTEVYNTENGGLPANDVYDMYPDNRGRLWIKTFGDKFGYIKNGVFKAISYNIAGRVSRSGHFSEVGGIVYFIDEWENDISIVFVDDDVIKVSTFKHNMPLAEDSSGIFTISLAGNFTVDIWMLSMNLFQIDSNREHRMKYLGIAPRDFRWNYSYGLFMSPANEAFKATIDKDELHYLDVPTMTHKAINIKKYGGDASEKIVTYCAYFLKGNRAANTAIITNSHMYFVSRNMDFICRKSFGELAPASRSLVYKLVDRNDNVWFASNGDGVWFQPRCYDFYAQRTRMPALSNARYIGSVKQINYWWNKQEMSLYCVHPDCTIDIVKFPRAIGIRSISGNDSLAYISGSDAIYELDTRVNKVVDVRKKYHIITTLTDFNGNLPDSLWHDFLFHETRNNALIGNTLYALIGNGCLKILFRNDTMYVTKLDNERYSDLFYDEKGRSLYFYSNNRIFIKNLGDDSERILKSDFLRKYGIDNIKHLEKDKFGNVFILDETGLFIFNEERRSIKEIETNFSLADALFHIQGDDFFVAGKFGMAFAAIDKSGELADFKVVPNTGGNRHNKLESFILNGDGQAALHTDIEAYYFSVDSFKKHAVDINKENGFFTLVLLRPSEKRINGNDTFRFRQSENVIKLDAINAYGRGAVKYTYRIADNKKWEQSSSGEIFLAALQPGMYHRVECRLNDGLWQSKVYTFYVYRYPHWWQTATWNTVFWVTGILLLVALILGVILVTRYYSRKKEEKKRALTELELRAIHAQINPHFIFNTLSAALFFINKKRFDDAYIHVSKFSKLLRAYLKASQNRFVLLGEEIEMLRNYIELQQIRFDEKFEYEIEIDNKLPVNNIKIPSLLLQPLVENAINHGLFHRRDKGSLSLKFLQGESSNDMICIIEDNGIGREAAQKINDESSTKESYGTRLTNKLLEIFREYEHMDIKLEYTDIPLPQTGTRVTLTLKNLKYIA